MKIIGKDDQASTNTNRKKYLMFGGAGVLVVCAIIIAVVAFSGPSANNDALAVNSTQEVASTPVDDRTMQKVGSGPVEIDDYMKIVDMDEDQRDLMVKNMTPDQYNTYRLVGYTGINLKSETELFEIVKASIKSTKAFMDYQIAQDYKTPVIDLVRRPQSELSTLDKQMLAVIAEFAFNNTIDGGNHSVNDASAGAAYNVKNDGAGHDGVQAVDEFHPIEFNGAVASYFEVYKNFLRQEIYEFKTDNLTMNGVVYNDTKEVGLDGFEVSCFLYFTHQGKKYQALFGTVNAEYVVLDIQPANEERMLKSIADSQEQQKIETEVVNPIAPDKPNPINPPSTSQPPTTNPPSTNPGSSQSDDEYGGAMPPDGGSGAIPGSGKTLDDLKDEDPIGY